MSLVRWPQCARTSRGYLKNLNVTPNVGKTDHKETYKAYKFKCQKNICTVHHDFVTNIVTEGLQSDNKCPILEVHQNAIPGLFRHTAPEARQHPLHRQWNKGQHPAPGVLVGIHQGIPHLSTFRHGWPPDSEYSTLHHPTRTSAKATEGTKAGKKPQALIASPTGFSRNCLKSSRLPQQPCLHMPYTKVMCPKTGLMQPFPPSKQGNAHLGGNYRPVTINIVVIMNSVYGVLDLLCTQAIVVDHIAFLCKTKIQSSTVISILVAVSHIHLILKVFGTGLQIYCLLLDVLKTSPVHVPVEILTLLVVHLWVSVEARITGTADALPLKAWPISMLSTTLWFLHFWLSCTKPSTD